MKFNQEWFVRFEPNFQSSQQTILYNKLNGDLYELSEVYFDFINMINDVDEFNSTLLYKYQVSPTELDDLVNTIKENLIELGVIMDE